MATERVLKQMAEFDFSKPIKVEIIFEDSDDDKPSLQSSLSEQQKLNDNNNNKQVPVENSKTNSNKHDEIFENQNNNKSLNKSMLSLNSRILQRKPSKEISQDDNAQNLNNSKDAEKTKNPNDIEYNQNTLVANRHTLDFIDNNTINVEERLGNTRQNNQNNEHQEPATFIEDLLNKLSEHIFLIMQSFHHYGMKIPNKDNKKREEVYNFIKSHFYELSYSTVESIILPQEQNVSFINKFLDNTVLIVNNKSSQWKCNRGHVLPFFTELMTWTKRKRESIQNNPPSSTSNENILLKQQLVRPLLPVNLPQSEIVANTNVESQKTQSNLCIFSSGPPGKEISINIDSNTLNQINGRQQLIGDSNTLNQINERQQLTGKEAKQTGINNNSTERVESTRRKTSVARAPCRNRVKYVQNNNPQYDRPPPAYDSIYNTGRIPYTMPQQYSHNPPTHAGQPHQNHPSTGQHNHSNQVHYVNTNRTLPPPVLQNYLYDNTNNNNPMYRTQIETQDTSSPVIRNVSSLNPNTRVLMYRCCMCGKKTMSPCNPYNPCRMYFCSYLCQELDSQYYKPKWGNAYVATEQNNNTYPRPYAENR